MDAGVNFIHEIVYAKLVFTLLLKLIFVIHNDYFKPQGYNYMNLLLCFLTFLPLSGLNLSVTLPLYRCLINLILRYRNLGEKKLQLEFL